MPGPCGCKAWKRATGGNGPEFRGSRRGGISSTSRKLFDRVQQVTPADGHELHKFNPQTSLPPRGRVETLDDIMNHLAYWDIEGRFCWAGRDQGSLAKLKHIDSNIPLACGVKSVKRIDDRPPQVPGLESLVRLDRAGLALWGISSTSSRQIARVQQDMDANLPFTTQPPSNATH